MRILSLGQLSTARTIQTVSLRRFPFSRTVSPLNSCSSSILAWERHTTELSSLVDSSTSSLLGRSFLRRMAVARSSFLGQRNQNNEGSVRIQIRPPSCRHWSTYVGGVETVLLTINQRRHIIVSNKNGYKTYLHLQKRQKHIKFHENRSNGLREIENQYFLSIPIPS